MSKRATGRDGQPDAANRRGTQALRRSETVAVTVDGREGFVRRPNLVGALVVKAIEHDRKLLLETAAAPDGIARLKIAARLDG